MKTYSELLTFDTFEDRFNYLKLGGVVGEDTFGFDRWLNQKFYKNPEWKSVRNEVIIRDDGCCLGIPDRPIFGTILVHHMNPITKDDILYNSDILLNPDYLICVDKITHNAIHYGDENILITIPNERHINDTCPWR